MPPPGDGMSAAYFQKRSKEILYKVGISRSQVKVKGNVGEEWISRRNWVLSPWDGTEIPHESPQLPKVPEEAYSSWDTQAMWWSLKVSLKRHTPPSPPSQAGRMGRWTMESGWNQLSSKQWHLFHSVCEYKEISWPYKCSFVTFCLELICCNYSKF